MSRGTVVVVSGVRQNDGNITNFVLVNCLVAAWAGLLFGYDTGCPQALIIHIISFYIFY